MDFFVIKIVTTCRPMWWSDEWAFKMFVLAWLIVKDNLSRWNFCANVFLFLFDFCYLNNKNLILFSQTGPHRWNHWTTWCWCANLVRLRSPRAVVCFPSVVLFEACQSIRLWTTCSVSFQNSDYHRHMLCGPNFKRVRSINKCRIQQWQLHIYCQDCRDTTNKP